MPSPDSYLSDRFEAGKHFEQFVYDALAKKGCIISEPYTTREEQLKGENNFGIEIKFQERMFETGNLWFEVMEKTHPEDEHWRLSGIWRRDNSWLLVSGYWHRLYIFAIRDLRRHQLCGGVEVRENNRHTSLGWLMDTPTARRIALKRYNTEQWYEGYWRPNNVG